MICICIVFVRVMFDWVILSLYVTFFVMLLSSVRNEYFRNTRIHTTQILKTWIRNTWIHDTLIRVMRILKLGDALTRDTRISDTAQAQAQLCK